MKRTTDPLAVVDLAPIPDDHRDPRLAVLERYHGRIMTPATFAALRIEMKARCGVEHVFPLRRETGRVLVGPMSADQFREVVGCEPEGDSLERVNCLESGRPGHHMCGWCDEHAMPRFKCGCWVQ